MATSSGQTCLVMSHIPTQSGGAWNEMTGKSLNLGVSTSAVQATDVLKHQSGQSKPHARDSLRERSSTHLSGSIGKCSLLLSLLPSARWLLTATPARLVFFFPSNSAFFTKAVNCFTISPFELFRGSHHAPSCLALPPRAEPTTRRSQTIRYSSRARLRHFSGAHRWSRWLREK